MVAQLKSAEEFATAIATPSKLVVVDFFATWCGPCKMIAPLIEKFAEQYAEGAVFYKLDVDEVGAVAQEQEVSAMPTILFYRDGKVVDKVIGANPNAIKQKLVANV